MTIKDILHIVFYAIALFVISYAQYRSIQQKAEIEELKIGSPGVFCKKLNLSHKTTVYETKKNKITIWCE